ncbi:unnamed protein product [Urochloa humidicola]
MHRLMPAVAGTSPAGFAAAESVAVDAEVGGAAADEAADAGGVGLDVRPWMPLLMWRWRCGHRSDYHGALLDFGHGMGRHGDAYCRSRSNDIVQNTIVGHREEKEQENFFGYKEMQVRFDS